MDRKHCKGPNCRRPIVWVWSEKGKRLCLDADPIPLEAAHAEPRGVFWLDDQSRAIAWSPALLAEVGDLYRTHWGTCPDRDTFRRR